MFSPAYDRLGQWRLFLKLTDWPATHSCRGWTAVTVAKESNCADFAAYTRQTAGMQAVTAQFEPSLNCNTQNRATAAGICLKHQKNRDRARPRSLMTFCYRCPSTLFRLGGISSVGLVRQSRCRCAQQVSTTNQVDFLGRRPDGLCTTQHDRRCRIFRAADRRNQRGRVCQADFAVPRIE
jgi:hypothetical protein